MLEALLPQGRWAADALGRHSLRTGLIVDLGDHGRGATVRGLPFVAV